MFCISFSLYTNCLLNHSSSLRKNNLFVSPPALPKDCAEAYEWVSKDGVDYTESGEYLISPNPDVIKPFMVFCDFTTGKGET